MKKLKLGITLGIIAGIIDVVPMLIQNLSWDADLSAFCMWVLNGFLIATSSIKLKGALKGLLISFLVIIPTVIIVGAKDPVSLIPISIMTTILGSLLGYFIDKLTSNQL
jgi:hypothetical protein